MKNLLLVLVLFLAVSKLAIAQTADNTPVGTWTNEDKEARFEIYKCGSKLCGKIVWLKEPLRDGKPKLDRSNPDKNLQNRPILGLIFMQNFESDSDNKWDNGTIYDPKSGKTYSCYMKVLSKDQMEVKGYIGISLIGRTQNWVRVK
ncbi:DUF2147 domain-containing protein [Adhaeribacter pallidiroseus]|uniref:DUF2147 domain-containing protein n=1 Tax=Adhaeribacter pallidiroseus TaxID=2072847 RepID=A0A369QLD8_9BACT|nr:DUF2147 domain-containing protein [Adhaeribacter pallidiroseus]RDC65160.1 hypothetical protein AHMF7616_03790 [Adhaeribacter pallidiroseus]